MLKTFALIFGVFFLAIGVLGFIPEASPTAYLFGIFHVGVFHNLIHLVTGVIGLWAASLGFKESKLFFRVFGPFYVVMAALGFMYADAPVFGLIANSMANVWLYSVIAAVFLYFGFLHSSIS